MNWWFSFPRRCWGMRKDQELLLCEQPVFLIVLRVSLWSRCWFVFGRPHLWLIIRRTYQGMRESQCRCRHRHEITAIWSATRCSSCDHRLRHSLKAQSSIAWVKDLKCLRTISTMRVDDRWNWTASGSGWISTIQNPSIQDPTVQTMSLQWSAEKFERP